MGWLEHKPSTPPASPKSPDRPGPAARERRSQLAQTDSQNDNELERDSPPMMVNPRLLKQWSPAAALLAATLFFSHGARAANACESLADIGLPDVKMTSAAMQAAGALALPNGHKIDNLPAFCRVAGQLRPTPDSDIGFELWMPPAEAWNGKTLVVGNGGYVGSIRYDELEPAIRRGYAVISSDSGHVDAAGYRNENLNWGVGHPEKIADWAYRSVHAAAAASRAIVRTFERRDASHAYYFGCSTGGGQGLMAAQRYPDDFDGIIAGAPGNNRTALNQGFLWGATQNLKTKAGYIPPSKLPLINQAAISACDAQDGLADGLIGDPRQCRFDPKVLQCKDDADGAQCLTGAQVDTLRRLYAGAQNPRTRAQIYPGWPVGSEFGYLGGWGYAIEGPQAFRTEFFKDWVFKDANWDWRSFDWDRDVAIVKARIGATVDATDPDLGAFRKRGGKLILYHGLADPIGNAYDTIQYYEAVGKTVSDTPAFARLFLAPGMGHCRSGIGPNAFDAIGALEDWVEKGQAPARIVALKADATDKVGGLASSAAVKGNAGRTRPLCAYPQVARYKGSGSIDDERNFTCAAPL
ncbi:tannase/feruloyl esterase family alpha/beta hydrolase [Cupriavidus sp. 2TAF22]|uniref:tannase/feruloyl esterase family alpha/beta hydrolase n=1 Tax=unclassified Cupriavidus TaxID=2640874 RepID=UPI003F921865